MPPYWAEAMTLMVEHGKLLGLILIVPLLSILSWMFFRKSRYNLAENFVLQSFVMGQANILRTLIFIPAFLLAPHTADLNSNIFQGVFLIYMIIANRQFFRENLVATILKTTLSMFLFIALYWTMIWGFVYIRHFFIH